MTTSRDNLPAVPEETKPETKAPTIPGVLWALAGLIFRREALLVVAACVVMVAIGATGVVWAQDKLDGGISPLRVEMMKRDDSTNARVDAIERKFDAAEERNARRFEVLYNAVLERRPQPGADALMQPVKDGGP